jgi:prolyl 4-hydroxylase
MSDLRGRALQMGGQRLAQCVVYLNTLPQEAGGATRFHHPALGGLSVQPRQGDALLFFSASAGGAPDYRMTHSGEPVLRGEKWILNTWLCQYPLPR